MSSPAKRRMGLWPQISNTPTMVPDSRYLSPYFTVPTAVPLLTNPYYYGDILYRRNQPTSSSTSGSEQYSHELNRDKTSLSVKTATYSASNSSRESVEKDSDIHPAFRWTTDAAQSKYLETKSVPPCSNGVLYNPLTSIMYFPTPGAWSMPGSRAVSETLKRDDSESDESNRPGSDT